MGIIDKLLRRNRQDSNQELAGQQGQTSERGQRTTPENYVKYLYRSMWVDAELRATILDIRNMDKMDPRVKKIHRRTVSAAIKGGLKLENPGNSRVIKRAWDKYQRRLQLHRREKLFSDGRGLMMEGNLLLQWVLDDANRVAAGVRMPVETMQPIVNPNGQYTSVAGAFEQFDLTSGARIATFPLWNITHTRLTPDNFDDNGSMGRPYLDATRTVWKKLIMTEEDLVIRRRMRAPLRLSHILEGASDTALEKYRDEIEKSQAEGNSNDYFSNKKGSVTPIQGDATLSEIADIEYLLDTFFSGSPAPAGLFGYPGDLNRDILEDLKRDFFEEVDALQDEHAYAYQQGFILDLLLQGIVPDNHEFNVVFAERRTETLNQAADRALKYQAAGSSQQTVFDILNLDIETEAKRKAAEKDKWAPYPDPGNIGMRNKPNVSVTPGNQPKGESATTISTRSGNT